MTCATCHTNETTHHFDRGEGYLPICLECMTNGERTLVALVTATQPEGTPNV